MNNSRTRKAMSHLARAKVIFFSLSTKRKIRKKVDSPLKKNMGAWQSKHSEVLRKKKRICFLINTCAASDIDEPSEGAGNLRVQMWGSEQPNWGWFVEAETLDSCFEQVCKAWSLSLEMQKWLFGAILWGRVQAQVWLRHWESQAHRAECWELFAEGQKEISSDAASAINSSALNAAEISR